MIVHTCVEAALTLLLQGVCRHRDDRNLLEPWIAAEQLGSGDAIHFRHLQIHEHNVKANQLFALRQNFHRLSAMTSEGDDRTSALQDFGRDLLIYLIIFDQQHADPGRIMRDGISLRRTSLLLAGRDTKQID